MNVKKILPVIGLIILAYILYTLDFNQILQLFSMLNPWYGFLSFFTIVPLLFLVNIQWQILLKKQKINVSYWYSLKNFFIGYFYGFITPGAFGAYARALYLQDESNEPLPKCFSNIVIFNTIESLAMLTTGAIGAIVLSRYFPYLFYIIIVLICFILFLFIFFFKTKKAQALFTRLIKSQIFSAVHNRLQGNLHSFYEDIPRFKDVLIPFGLSLTGWMLKFTILYYIASMFSIRLPYIDFILIIAVVDVIAALPISIYGIGTREAALIPLLAIYGISSEQIVSFSLFWYVIIWLTPSLLGAAITVLETKKGLSFELTDQTMNQFHSYMKQYPELYEDIANLIKKKTTTSPYQLILDIGCGPGLLGAHIKKNQQTAQIIGIDTEQTMIQLAKKENTYENLIKATVQQIPLKDNVIDIAVSRFSLPYWNNPQQSFNEIQRVLKPQATLILEALNKNYPKWKLWITKLHMSFKKAGSDVIRYHIDAYETAKTKKEIKHYLQQAGFTQIEFLGDENDWKYVFIAKKTT